MPKKTTKVNRLKENNTTAVVEDVNEVQFEHELAPSNQHSDNRNVKASSKTIEEIYQKKTQLEHILLRPDTYIGSIEAIRQSMWVWDSGESAMKYREISYVPGLYKIFDEILVNAADNKVSAMTTNRLTQILPRSVIHRWTRSPSSSTWKTRRFPS